LKILCVIDSLGSGGAQRQLVGLALGFKEKGHNVSFLTYHNITFYNPLLEKEKIEITCIQEPHYLKRLIKMRRFIRRGKFDAVLSFLEAPSFICELAGLPFRKWRLVVGERLADPQINHSIRLKVYRWLHVLADCIICNSKTNKKLIHSVNKIVRNSKLEVIYNIVDFNYWKPLPDFIFRKNSKLKLVIPASLNSRKNLNGLLEALSLLNQDERSKIAVAWYGDQATETVTGNPITEASDKIRASGLEQVISVYPATHEILSIIQEADAVGLFSFSEGLPNAVCEGMACAKPIICSAVSDMPEFLSHTGNLLCDPQEPQSIKRAISFLIGLNSDELMQIGLQNQQIAQQRFDREGIINQYLKHLGTLS
jgi:glycosyltransferase involved in cell wall biosynthesis